MAYIIHAVDLEPVHHSRLAGVGAGHNHALEAPLASHDGHRQHALDGLQRAVQAQLAHQQEAGQTAFGIAHHLGGGQHPDGQRQVVGGTFLSYVRGSHVHHQAGDGQAQPGGLKGGQDAAVALLDRGVGQADQVEHAAFGAADFDGNGDGVDAQHGRAIDFD